MLAMGIYGDQLPNSMRLREAGVALSPDKDNFTAEEVSTKISGRRPGRSFWEDRASYEADSSIAARRKEMAADLVEQSSIWPRAAIRAGVESIRRCYEGV